MYIIFESLRDIEITLFRRKKKGIGGERGQRLSDGEMLSECHDNPGEKKKYKATTTEALNLSKAHHLMITEQCGLSSRRFLYLLQS